MKKYRYAVLELCFLIVFCVLQAGHTVLWEYVQRTYTGYLITCFHFVCAVLLGFLFWAVTNVKTKSVQEYEKGIAAALWVILGLAGLPYPLQWLGTPEVSNVLIGFSWLIAVWHLFDFISSIQSKKREG